MSLTNFIRAPRFSFLQPQVGLWLVVLCVAWLFIACGGSKNTNVSSSESPEGDVDIDKLLSTPTDQEKANAEDAEVLKLLGITPDNAKTDVPQAEATVTEPKTEPSQPTTSDIQKEVDRLQRELNEKNQQVTELRNSLMERDARIQELQQTQQAGAAQTSRAARTTGADGFVQRYSEARNLYEQRRYTEAIAVFQEILAGNDKSSYADNCQYWIGECYYGLGKYEQAIAEFEKVFTFARSNKSDAALLKLGLCYVRLGERQQARSEFEQLLANYPSSPYVRNARRYLAGL
jgi:tol-pal system protein YbgF